MSIRKSAIALVVTMLLLSFPAAAFAGPPDDQAPMSDFWPEQILVKFKPNVTLPEAAQIHRQLGGQVKDTIPGIGVQVVKVPRGQEKAKVKAYSSNSRVEYAEPDFVAQALGSPNDPWFGNQWGMAKVQAPEAWDVTTGSPNINIAILDTGVDLDHPDLASKIVANINFSSSVTVDDVRGHGTHVAGIAAAITDNGLGVAGLGYDATIMNVKVLGDDGFGYYSWIVQGVIWAADNGAEVINMSLGGSSPSSTLENAVNYAWSKGVVVVAAAGNEGSTTPSYPAHYTSCIAVAATDGRDYLSTSSNRGDWVDVAAPGVAIFSTVKDGDYYYKSGTSMASPHVAGLAALVFTVVTDSNGNGRLNDEVRARIEATCDDIGVTGIGAGRINAYKAVTGGGPSEPVTGAIGGRVTDAGSGLPVAGATVAAGTKTATTDASGQYTIGEVPQGSHTVTASATGYSSSSQTVSVTAGQTSTANFALAKLPSPGSIAGKVTDAADGSPIAGAVVSCDGVSVTSNSDGEFVISNLSQGVYAVTASASGYTDASQTVEVLAGQTSVANFALVKLPPPAPKGMWVESITFRLTGKNLNISVKVVSDTGALAGASVGLTVSNAGQSWYFNGVTDSSGGVSLTINKAPAGTYVATVTSLTAEGYAWDASQGVTSASYTLSSKRR